MSSVDVVEVGSTGWLAGRLLDDAEAGSLASSWHDDGLLSRHFVLCVGFV